ncbi:hypothetical protein [Jiangella alba]|uniref:ABC-2 family transporter protein n=1 Tax=Jiangella alba TaxID=561176 RepID=A0A1H5PY38_9ACTN|nr:hypothetical protein [Jiangella alba]SEF18783.1 hypothetical protein SAMN04488561_6853 [Jiangella alba]
MELDQLTTDDTAQAGPPESSAAPTGWRRAIGLGLGLAALVGVLVTAFAWPPAESSPRDVPVAVVGTAAAADRLEQQLDDTMPGALDLRRATSADDARALIEEREVYGAIVLGPSGPSRVLTASGAGPVVAQLLAGIADGLAEPASTSATVEDVVPLPDDDPRGATFTAAALPMVLGGMIVGILMSFLVTGVWRRVAGALVAALAAGGVVTLIAQAWLGTLQGSAWANAGAVALIVAAISLTITGLVALLGPAGIGLGAVVMFLIGNSISGVSSAPELLPTGWGTLGQALPAGAGGTLLRSTSYFDGAAAGSPVLVLAAWAAGGLVLVALGRRVRPAAHHALAG